MKTKYILLFIFCLAIEKGFSQYDTTGHQFHGDPKWILSHNNADADAKSFYVNFSLPFQGTPMYTDNTGSVSDNSGNGSSSSYSHIDAPLSFFGLKVEPVWRIVNNDYIKLQVSGSVTYSNSTIISDIGSVADSLSSTTGVSEFDYTYGGELDLGSKFVKILGLYEGGYRDLVYTSSGSSSGSDLSTSTTTTGNASYNYWRAGAGLNFRLNGQGNPESYIKLIYYYEKPDYGMKTTGYGLELKSWLNVSFQYFPNYPIAGQPSFPVDNAGTKQAFWYVSIGKSISF
jgi:hypothetical protein